MLKLIATDLDGSLLNHGEISPKNLETINLIKQLKIKLVVATGRDYMMIQPLIKKNKLDCYYLTGNGAEFRNKNGELIDFAYFDASKYKAVSKVLAEYGLPFILTTTNGFYCEGEPHLVREKFLERGRRKFGHSEEPSEERKKHMPCYLMEKIEDIDEFLNSNPTIIKFEAFSLEGEKVIASAKKSLAQIPDIAFLSSFEDNIEITNITAQKGLVLEKFCQQLNINQDEVMIFGDGMNDITMFEKFKYGLAPSNALKEIQAVAYKIVASCEEDGFSDAVNFMLNKLA